MPYFTAVVSSAAYWPNPPSPVTATTGLPGAAAQAPSAAGYPKPIEPRYPDISTGWPFDSR